MISKSKGYVKINSVNCLQEEFANNALSPYKK